VRPGGEAQTSKRTVPGLACGLAQGTELRVELALLACIEIPGQTVVVDAHRQAWLGPRRQRGGDAPESLGGAEDNVRPRRVEHHIHANICSHTPRYDGCTNSERSRQGRLMI
jgi:hypothetical protein